MARKPSNFKIFLWGLFEANHTTKLSDETLKKIIREHFPQSKLDVPLGRHKDRLAVWRSEYNRNLLPSPATQRSVKHVSVKPKARRKDSDR
jgi:hypothetical protein